HCAHASKTTANHCSHLSPSPNSTAISKRLQTTRPPVPTCCQANLSSTWAKTARQHYVNYSTPVRKRKPRQRDGNTAEYLSSTKTEMPTSVQTTGRSHSAQSATNSSLPS